MTEVMSLSLVISLMLSTVTCEKRQCWDRTFPTSALFRLPNALVVLEKYHHLWKVRATHKMLDHRTTIMAFTECTDLHFQPHATTGHTNFLCLYKNILNQPYSNSPQQDQLFHYRD